MGTEDEDGFEDAISRPGAPSSTQAQPKKPRVEKHRESPRAFEGDPDQAAQKVKAEVSHMNSVQDSLDSQIPEDELCEARIEELRKLMELCAFRAVRKD